MIQGCFTISGTVDNRSSQRLNCLQGSGAVFHKAEAAGFEGGYWLHPLLPCRSEDHYYSDESDDILILVSGSLYNSAELYPLCGISSPVPAPELIAKLFLREGPGFIGKLNGDLAIFIARPSIREAYLFRDHLGIRPLAWTIDNDKLYFSTDITGLCRSFAAGEEIETDFLLGYFKYTDYRKTPVRKVQKLLPGHYLVFSGSGADIKRYWEPEKIRKDKTLTHDQMIYDLKALLTDAVKIRCDKRFTAGSHVSSGLDSGIVSALARNEYGDQKEFYGFSWSPVDHAGGDLKYDERTFVIKSAEKGGIIPHFSGLDLADISGFVKDPYCSPWYWSEGKTVREAAELKVNLIFSGWGGDEFISTGDRGIEQDLLKGLYFRIFFRRNPVRHLKKFIRDQLFFVVYPAIGLLDRSTARSFNDDARYIKKPFKVSDRNALRNFYFHTSRRQMHLRLLCFYHLQERCESWAVNGFSKGVEYRYPLLDKRIVEYMIKVPSELLCKTNYFRPLLREIGEGILHGDVRLMRDKSDPVYWSFISELYKGSAPALMEEVKEWKANPDLHFVDHDLLTEDIGRFRKSPDSINSKLLFRAIVYLSWMNSFTNKFRETVAPEEEQNVCLKCGFCCDGTLFIHAHLNPGERGHLPVKIEENSFTSAGKDFFRLPCQYFLTKCTIYDRKRADVCSAYRCQLLKDLAEGKITAEEAPEVVVEAMKMRSQIFEDYRRITGNNSPVTFRQILTELRKVQRSAGENKPASAEIDILTARCNIFEALLIKHFRSAGDFENLMKGSEDKR